jgi:uncharacterized membrane protein YgcG
MQYCGVCEEEGLDGNVYLPEEEDPTRPSTAITLQYKNYTSSTLDLYPTSFTPSNDLPMVFSLVYGMSNLDEMQYFEQPEQYMDNRMYAMNEFKYDNVVKVVNNITHLNFNATLHNEYRNNYVYADPLYIRPFSRTELQDFVAVCTYLLQGKYVRDIGTFTQDTMTVCPFPTGGNGNGNGTGGTGNGTGGNGIGTGGNGTSTG